MYAAVDIGGTKTLVAVFNADGTISEQSKFPTSPDYQTFLTDLANTVANLSTKSFVSGALGLRGNINRETGFSLFDDVLKWGQVAVRDDCSKILSCPLLMENDSKLAGLSEAILIKEEFRKVLYVTISTGIGSAFIVDGKLDQNTINSEVGKSLFEHDGKLQQWEDFASGRAIVATYHKPASEIEDPASWHQIAQNIAVGLIDIVAAYTPEVVVFGGGVGAHFDKFEQPLAQIIQDIKPVEIVFPALRAAQRPEEAVIYGCYELIRQSNNGHN